ENSGFRSVALEGRVTYLTLQPVVAWQIFGSRRRREESLASNFHKGLERNGGESVRRLDNTEPHENTLRRHSEDRL
ncbi:MAG: hypothetical protein ACREVW_17500, partial [Burkholderiales bacterium]